MAFWQQKREMFILTEDSTRTATCSDRMTVKIPEGWDVFQGVTGNVMVEAPWGWTYDINEVLQGNKNPYFYALDKNMKGHRAILEEV